MIKKIVVGLSLLAITSISYALPFSIVPKSGTSLPTVVNSGSAVTAYYTVTNNTQTQRNSNYVKYLSPNVTQVTSSGTYTDTCGSTFDLAPKGQAGDSCTLQLTITGSVNANDPNPHNHLFVCFPQGTTCAGTSYPLNISSGAPLYAYISNNGNDTLSYCTLNVDGTFNTCASTGSNVSNPAGMAINSAGTLLYVTNENGSLQNTVSYCAINSNGTLNACNTTGSNLFSPTDIAFNPAGNIAYVANETAGIVYCPVNADGSFGTCTSTGSGFSNPAGIRVNAANTFAYVANFGNNTISFCSINANGSFGSCSTAASGISQPNSIEINPAGNIIYVTNKNTNAVSYCSINADGSIGSCNTTSSSFNVPFYMAFNSSGTLAYVANSGSNNVSYCAVNSTGTFSSCNTTGSGFNSPRGIVFGN